MIESDHPLRRWRVSRGLNLAQVVVQIKEIDDTIKVSSSHLSEIERGKNTPSLALAARISKVTGGEVRVEDFVASEAAG